MTFLVLLAAGVMVVVLVHIVVGWQISNGLRRGALDVGTREKALGVRVRAVGEGRIVLEAPTARQDIGHPGTIGLAWDGGYGQVGDVVAANDMRITRRWRSPDGEPPVCVGPLESCVPVALDSYAFPGDPADLGLEFETTTFDTPLGAMGAWKVPGGTGDRWAVMCHGWTAEKRELLRMLPAFRDRGLTSLVIDYRNDPGMPGDPSGRHRFGLTEWADLEGAVEHALAAGADSVVLMGCSTGGALVMRFLELSGLADRVSAVVMDAPNIVLADTFRHAIRVPRVSTLMFEFGLWLADIRWGIDWDTTNFVGRAEDIITVPTLVFHGTSDATVPIATSRRLAARLPDLVRLVETPAAGHVMSWNADPGRYEGYLSRFLDETQN